MGVCQGYGGQKYPETYIADDTEYPAGEFFALARDAGAVTYGNVGPDYQGEVPQLNSQDMAVANMYRVWDYGPLIEAYDLYYTLRTGTERLYHRGGTLEPRKGNG